MKKLLEATNAISLCLLLMLTGLSAIAQSTVISLYKGKAPGSEKWSYHEGIYFDEGMGEKFAYNVTDPTLTVYKPDPSIINGTAVVVCPGGAFHILSLDNEGEHVAKWLNSLGITAFVLKYRLAESKTSEPLKELGQKIGDIKNLDLENARVVPLAIEDGMNAIRYVREHADEFAIKKDHIGIIGFSAGGTVTAGVGFNYTNVSRPDFVAPIYAYTGALTNTRVQTDAPPLFVAAATDDGLGFAPHSVRLYNLWIDSKKAAELHIFSKGGHGFGMKTQHLPVDQWRNLFADWMKQIGML